MLALSFRQQKARNWKRRSLLTIVAALVLALVLVLVLANVSVDNSVCYRTDCRDMTAAGSGTTALAPDTSASALQVWWIGHGGVTPRGSRHRSNWRLFCSTPPRASSH